MTGETKYKKKQFGGRAKIVFLLPILFLALTYVSGKTHAEEFDFDLSIGYMNSAETVDIPKRYGIYTPKTAINPTLHDGTSPISINISNGTFDESSNLEIKISIEHQPDATYEKTVTKTGAELKNGTSIELDGFVMSAPTIEEYIQNDGEERYYDGEIRIGDISRQLIMFYGYEQFGNAATIVDKENKTFYNYNPPYYHLNKERLGSFKISLSSETINDGRAAAIAIGYSNTEAIKDDDLFGYSVYKREGQISQTSPYYYASQNISDYSPIETGTIAGKDLKNDALILPIAVGELGQSVYYAFVLQDNQVLKAFVVEVAPWGGPGIESYTAKSETAQMYSKSGAILSPKDTLIVQLKGINFNENEKYTISPEPNDQTQGFTLLCKTGEDPSPDIEGHVIHQGDNGEEIYCQTRWGHSFEEREYTGEELNNGTATIEIPYIEYAEQYSDAFIIKDSNGNSYPGGKIEVIYKDANELAQIAPNSGYSFVDNKNCIKNIKKLTTAQEFIDNVFARNNSDHIDVEGIANSNEKLSTGMNARIVNEYNRTIAELKTIVVGDTDGDGDITANDLAKERQHLSGRRLLKGVYKIAGSASGDDEITPTDLARMRQDLSGKREMRQ